MEQPTAKQIIEAILFLDEEPVRVDQICNALSLTRKQATALLQELQQDLAQAERGLRLFAVAGGYRLGTDPALSPYLEKYFSVEENENLSNAALETLAIIAYKQPVTRLEIESLRGVKCEHVLDRLLKRKLIRITGRGTTAGRPMLYGTTADFLHYFGLTSMADLPPLEQPGT